MSLKIGPVLSNIFPFSLSVKTNDLDDDSLMDFLEDPSAYEENQNDNFITKNELSANELSTIILKVQDLCEFLQKTDTSNR